MHDVTLGNQTGFFFFECQERGQEDGGGKENMVIRKRSSTFASNPQDVERRCFDFCAHCHKALRWGGEGKCHVEVRRAMRVMQMSGAEFQLSKPTIQGTSASLQKSNQFSGHLQGVSSVEGLEDKLDFLLRSASCSWGNYCLCPKSLLWVLQGQNTLKVRLLDVLSAS